jgi:hypothetical protein
MWDNQDEGTSESNSCIFFAVVVYETLHGISFHVTTEGLTQVQHIGYFQAHGLELCHPSFWSNIDGSYAIDDSIGVGVSLSKIGWTRNLTLWDYSSWALGKPEKSPYRRLIYFLS